MRLTRKIYTTITFLLIIMSLCFCRKSLFKRITFTGRVVNYITKAPVITNLRFVAYTGHSNQIAEQLGNTQTDANGNFSIKCYAWQNNDYRVFDDNAGGAPVGSASGSKDFGNLEGGKCTFLLKVTIVPVSTSAIEFPVSGPNNTLLHFNAGTSTSFVTSWDNVNKYQFDGRGQKFSLESSTFPGGVQSDTLRQIPITSLDTLRVTINY